MQAVYSYHYNKGMSLQAAENNLFHSIHKSYELYHLLLMLLVEIHVFAINRIEIGKNKKLPKPEELNPNTRFIDNLLLHKLSQNQKLNNFIKQTGISWGNNQEFIKLLYKEICLSDLYTEYMNTQEGDFELDKKFIVKLFEKVISKFEPLFENLEEQSIFWNDEPELIMSMIIKTLKDYKNNEENNQELMSEYKEDDDKEFVALLFRKSIINHSEILKLIKKYSVNWDLDRIAFLDVILIDIAITEILEFDKIPIKVTLNEYIEVAKCYSTPKSGNFINGILERIIKHYIQEGKINKTHIFA